MRRSTSLRLRWLAIAGQIGAVVFTSHGLGFEVPLVSASLAILASIAVNLFVTWKRAPRLTDHTLASLLTFDVSQLSVLLYLTGGLQNPFSLLLMVPVIVSAATLPLRHTMRLALLTIVLATALAFYHAPLPWYDIEPFRIPMLYLAGVWIALLLGLAFTVTSVWRIADENRTLAAALSATELVLQREQHLTRLDGLAAAAAHELGTPLATITLTAKELTRELEGLQREDAQLIVDQTKRCRLILARLSTLDDEGDVIGWLKVSNLLTEIIEPHVDVGPQIVVDLPPGPEPHLRRNAGILYGLGNLIENAVDYADAEVRIVGLWSETYVEIEVRDDGPGFAPEVLRQIGEPYLGEPYRDNQRRARGQSGLGLGFFIAKTLLERSGAEVTIRNAEGARVRVRWPASAFHPPGERLPSVRPDEASDLPAMPSQPFLRGGT